MKSVHGGITKNQSKNIDENCKEREGEEMQKSLHITFIRLMIVYSAETMTMSGIDENLRKILSAAL